MKTEKDVTIYDIANALGISASTVSRGLKGHPYVKNELKKQIFQKAREMGYQQNKFASNLRQKYTSTLGVIVPRLDSYFMSTVISGMENVANQAGYNLIISQSLESAKKEAAGIFTLFNTRVDGLLVSLSSGTEDLTHFDPFFKKGIPVIFFDRIFEHSQRVSVIINNYKAGYEATSHLISQGYKNIVHIGGNLLRNVYSDRYYGYRQAMEDNRLPVGEKSHIITDLSFTGGVQAAATLLQQNPLPDAVFAANDSSAIAVMSEFRKAGIRIPEDVGIVGFNDDPVSRVIEPGLTTVHYPGKEMGEISASTLIKMIKGEQQDVLNTIVLSHSLIIRQSSVKTRSNI